MCVRWSGVTTTTARYRLRWVVSKLRQWQWQRQWWRRGRGVDIFFFFYVEPKPIDELANSVSTNRVGSFTPFLPPSAFTCKTPLRGVAKHERHEARNTVNVSAKVLPKPKYTLKTETKKEARMSCNSPPPLASVFSLSVLSPLSPPPLSSHQPCTPSSCRLPPSGRSGSRERRPWTPRSPPPSRVPR